MQIAIAHVCLLCMLNVSLGLGESSKAAKRRQETCASKSINAYDDGFL